MNDELNNLEDQEAQNFNEYKMEPMDVKKIIDSYELDNDVVVIMRYKSDKNPIALETLLNRYGRIITRLAGRYRPLIEGTGGGFNYYDLINAGFLGFEKAIITYDECRKKSSFGALIKLHVRDEMLGFINSIRYGTEDEYQIKKSEEIRKGKIEVEKRIAQEEFKDREATPEEIRVFLIRKHSESLLKKKLKDNKIQGELSEDEIKREMEKHKGMYKDLSEYIYRGETVSIDNPVKGEEGDKTFHDILPEEKVDNCITGVDEEISKPLEPDENISDENPEDVVEDTSLIPDGKIIQEEEKYLLTKSISLISEIIEMLFNEEIKIHGKLRKDIEIIKRRYLLVEPKEKLEEIFGYDDVKKANSRGFQYLWEYEDLINEMNKKLNLMHEKRIPTNNRVVWLRNVFKAYSQLARRI